MFAHYVLVVCDDCGDWKAVKTTRKRDAVETARGDGWTSPEWETHRCPDCDEGGRSA